MAPSALTWRHVSATRGASGAMSAVTPAAFGAFPNEWFTPPSYKICQPVTRGSLQYQDSELNLYERSWKSVRSEGSQEEPHSRSDQGRFRNEVCDGFTKPTIQSLREPNSPILPYNQPRFLLNPKREILAHSYSSVVTTARNSKQEAYPDESIYTPFRTTTEDEP